MFTTFTRNLEDIRNIIIALQEDEYTLPLDILSGSSVAAHVRHVIEFYQAILLYSSCNIICYDDRRHDIRIEQDRQLALHVLKELQAALESIRADKRVLVKSNFNIGRESSTLLDSSLYRELAYAFEHGVHHQALIKVGIRALGREEILTSHFGVAPSTQRYQRERESVDEMQ